MFRIRIAPSAASVAIVTVLLAGCAASPPLTTNEARELLYGATTQEALAEVGIRTIFREDAPRSDTEPKVEVLVASAFIEDAAGSTEPATCVDATVPAAIVSLDKTSFDTVFLLPPMINDMADVRTVNVFGRVFESSDIAAQFMKSASVTREACPSFTLRTDSGNFNVMLSVDEVDNAERFVESITVQSDETLTSERRWLRRNNVVIVISGSNSSVQRVQLLDDLESVHAGAAG